MLCIFLNCSLLKCFYSGISTFSNVCSYFCNIQNVVVRLWELASANSADLITIKLENYLNDHGDPLKEQPKYGIHQSDRLTQGESVVQIPSLCSLIVFSSRTPNMRWTFPHGVVWMKQTRTRLKYSLCTATSSFSVTQRKMQLPRCTWSNWLPQITLR